MLVAGVRSQACRRRGASIPTGCSREATSEKAFQFSYLTKDHRVQPPSRQYASRALDFSSLAEPLLVGRAFSYSEITKTMSNAQWKYHVENHCPLLHLPCIRLAGLLRTLCNELSEHVRSHLYKRYNCKIACKSKTTSIGYSTKSGTIQV